MDTDGFPPTAAATVTQQHCSLEGEELVNKPPLVLLIGNRQQPDVLQD